MGFGIVAHLLQHNAAKIIILSQKEEHAEEAIEELKKYGDTSKVQWTQLDLKSLKQTESVAKQLQSEKQIDAVRNSTPSASRYLANKLSLSAMLGRAWENTTRLPMS